MTRTPAPSRSWPGGADAARGTGGFTLVELLLTAAIAALLLGMLLPGLRHAREAARTGVCLSNLRQLVAGVQMYAGDFRGAAAPGASNFLRNRDRWHGARAAINQPFEPRGGSLSAYLGDEDSGAARPGVGRGVRACPTFAPALALLADARAGFERGNGGYGYNNAFLGVQRARVETPAGVVWNLVTDRRGTGLEQFASPARAAAFADAALVDTGSPADELIEYSFIEPRFVPDSPAFRLDPSVHFRHATAGPGSPGRAMVAFVDGHGASELRTFTHNSGIYGWPRADRAIGWFGVDDDNRLFSPR